MIKRCLFFFIGLLIHTLANAQNHDDIDGSLIKTFTDICYTNRMQINKIPLLVDQLHWKQSKSKTLSFFQMEKYLYKNYTIMTISNFDEVFCSIGVSNDNKNFGYKLADMLIEKLPPIGNVTKTQEYYSDNNLLSDATKDIETNYVREWLIEGGFKIVVALTDLEYQHIGSDNKRFVSVQLSRF